MRGRVREYVSLLKLEWAAYNQFPKVEGMFALLLGISLLFTSRLPGRDPTISIDTVPTWDGTGRYEYYWDYTLRVTTLALDFIFLAFAAASVVIISLSVAFDLGRSFEDGFAQTCLSYPVSRRAFISTKIFVLFMILLASASLSVLGSVCFFVPGPKPFFSIASYLISYSLFALMVISFTVLLAVVSKNASRPLVGSIAAWTGVLLYTNLNDVSLLVLWMSNPILLLSLYFRGGPDAPLVQDIFIGWLFSTAVFITFMIIIYVFFEREDIKGV